MTKHAILIGINQIPGMPYLASPSSYAIKMKEWAEEQGYITALFADEPEGVPIAGECNRWAILKTVRDLTAAGTDQLLIYFAGHGVERAPGEDIWLLPGYVEDPSESISIFACQPLAYRSGIAHVVFISDACRSPTSDRNVHHITPGVIFPILNREYRTDIDVFYSTHPGANSIDVRDDEDNYRSVYSDNLLKCLKGDVEEVIRPVRRLEPTFPAVLSYDLNDYLKTKVAEEIEEVTGKKQFPTGTVSSSDPLFLSRFDGQGLAENIGEAGIALPVELQPVGVDTKSVSEKLDFYVRAKGGGATREFRRISREFKRDYEFFTSDALFRHGDTGLFISGLPAPTVYGRREEDAHWFREGRNFTVPQLLGIDAVDRRENAIYFIGNHGRKRFYPVVVLPGFFTQVVFAKNEVLTVNYFPTGHNSKAEASYNATEVAERKANIIMAAQKGIFQGQYELDHGGGYYRRYKHLEPTLGLFAAYAYFQNGDFYGVRSLYDYLLGSGQSILADIKVLQRLSTRNPDFFPHEELSIPLLTQGWSYLDLLETNRHHHLVRYLQPGLWTSFDRDGFRYFEDQFIEL
ncbi:hypothetical protein DRF59_11185 [Chryseobacterium flavum]|uniref:Peptidase C14 caspase domain-containing protein n=1 Tax=Chryseobacterium flavum TaxID=415851 RepID=A0A3D9CMC4_9FLAO|nr:caspase family protein [Chryseobacterium flavum]REC66864.1 hypothetical protein DRF59_11185 [Chryseobacterium flavum]